jgi:cytochrome c biogenesis protein CcmG, thiol:disulfide interchange protein DsbE
MRELRYGATSRPAAGRLPAAVDVPVRTRLRRLAAGLALLAAATLAGCMPERGPVIGAAAPGFTGELLDGTRFDLRDERGSVVLVNVWATWCYPCRREMPGLQELHTELEGRGLRVVGVSIDAAGASAEISAFLAEHGIDFPIVHDPRQRVTHAFRTLGVPETFLIGRDGTLRHHWIGRIDARSWAVRGPVYDAVADGVLAAAPADAGAGLSR